MEKLNKQKTYSPQANAPHLSKADNLRCSQLTSTTIFISLQTKNNCLKSMIKSTAKVSTLFTW